MAELDFWNLIEKARRGGRLETDSLQEDLRKLSGPELVAFENELEAALDRLNTHEIQVALSGNRENRRDGLLSDDGFEYIRAGIIAQGKEAYDLILRDPETLLEGVWQEREELLYVAQEVIDSRGDSFNPNPSTLRWQASVNEQKYPVVRDKPLDEGFPSETFSWLQCAVVDTHSIPQAILEHSGGEVFVYPEYFPARRAFGIAARDVQEALRGNIDFTKLPNLTLSLLVLIGDADTKPQWHLMPDVVGEELDPGIAWGVSHEHISKLSPPEIEVLARNSILHALQFYFEGHPVEQRYVLEARISLGQ